jgi:hypothetical protein
MKDDATFDGILHVSGLRPVAALYNIVALNDGSRTQ